MAKLDLTALDLSALDGGPSLRGGAAVEERKTAPRAPLSAFEEDPDNPRTEFDDPEFADFVADVRVRGILMPVVVREIEGKLRIRFGHRRYRAAQLLHLADLPYVVTEDERQFDDYSQVSENQKRTPLQPLELAHFIQKKLNLGEKKKDVASKIGIDASAVTHLLSLVDAPAFLLELYHSRKCRAPHYLYELRKLHEKSPELVAERCQSADDIDRGFHPGRDQRGESETGRPSANTSPSRAAGTRRIGYGFHRGRSKKVLPMSAKVPGKGLVPALKVAAIRSLSVDRTATRPAKARRPRTRTSCAAPCSLVALMTAPWLSCCTRRLRRLASCMCDMRTTKAKPRWTSRRFRSRNSPKPLPPKFQWPKRCRIERGTLRLSS